MHRTSPLRVPSQILGACRNLIVGVVGLLVPRILGVGYNIINGILIGQFTVTVVISIIVSKAIAWVLAMGSQTSGGTLAPLFMVGSGVGFVYGQWVTRTFPNLQILNPGDFGIAAMAAVFATASRAPFTSIVFALEVTGDYQGVLPIIVTVVIAELAGEYLMEESIMTEKLMRRGLRVRHAYEYNPLRQIRI